MGLLSEGKARSFEARYHGSKDQVEQREGKQPPTTGERAEVRVEVRAEDKWKHDRNDARGRAWRWARHEARERWEQGVHPSNLKKFCVASCERCEEQRLLKSRE